jgi:Low affinity iron permease
LRRCHLQVSVCSRCCLVRAAHRCGCFPRGVEEILRLIARSDDADLPCSDKVSVELPRTNSCAQLRRRPAASRILLDRQGAEVDPLLVGIPERVEHGRGGNIADFQISDAWQLIANTVTNVITLMVFVIQNSQNRDSAAIQAKLDGLIRATSAHPALVGLEEETQEEIERVKDERKQPD